MSQPIVPLIVPQSRRFEKKSRNDILMKIRLRKVEVSVFESLNHDMLQIILDEVLIHDHPTQ
ncbi:hypothetical protein [Streptococcus sp. Marseille-Q7156]